MKIIIKEDKLDDFILKYINDYFDVDNIHFTHFEDRDGNPIGSAIEYYLGDYGDDHTLFRLYMKDYWKGDSRFQYLSPILYIEDNSFVNEMNSLFNERWEPIFKKWFKENSGEDVKTIYFD